MGRKGVKKGKGYRSPPPGCELVETKAGAEKVPLIPDTALRDEIDDNVCSIYDSFYCEFTKRVEERRAVVDPMLAEPLQRSALDDTVRCQLAAKVSGLVKTYSLATVYQMLEMRTGKFVAKLLAGVKEHTINRLRLALLEDAFDLVENAAEVIEGLVSPRAEVLLRFGKSEFFRIVEANEELRCILMAAGDSSFPRGLYADRAQRDSQDEMEIMSIEEIVCYINEKEVPSRKKGRVGSALSTADSSTSPRTGAERGVDQEVEAFRIRLERMKPYRHTLKPKVSEEWMLRLHTKIAQRMSPQ